MWLAWHISTRHISMRHRHTCQCDIKTHLNVTQRHVSSRVTQTLLSRVLALSLTPEIKQFWQFARNIHRTSTTGRAGAWRRSATATHTHTLTHLYTHTLNKGKGLGLEHSRKGFEDVLIHEKASKRDSKTKTQKHKYTKTKLQSSMNRAQKRTQQHPNPRSLPLSTNRRHA